MSTGKHQPLISIILVVKNAAKTVSQAVDSVLNQSYPHIELIVIDGASDDGTADILLNYQPSIAFFISEPDKGAASAINKGLKHVHGDLIATLFADDYYENGIFECVADAYLSNPAVEIISTGCRVVDGNDNHTIIHEQKRTPLTLRRFINSQSYVGCRFFNRSIFKNGTTFNSHDAHGHYNYANDTSFLLFLYLSKKTEVCIPHIGYTYLSGPQSTTYAHNPKVSIRCYEEEIRTIDHELSSDISHSPFNRCALLIMKQDRFFRLYRLSISSGLKPEERHSYIMKIIRRPFYSTIALAHIILNAGVKRLRFHLKRQLSQLFSYLINFLPRHFQGNPS